MQSCNFINSYYFWVEILCWLIKQIYGPEKGWVMVIHACQKEGDSQNTFIN